MCRLSGLLDNDCACNCERSDERESDEAAVGSRLGSTALGFVSGLGFLCGSGGVIRNSFGRKNFDFGNHAPAARIEIVNKNVACGDGVSYIGIAPAEADFVVGNEVSKFCPVFAVVGIESAHKLSVAYTAGVVERTPIMKSDAVEILFFAEIDKNLTENTGLIVKRTIRERTR